MAEGDEAALVAAVEALWEGEGGAVREPEEEPEREPELEIEGVSV